MGKVVDGMRAWNIDVAANVVDVSSFSDGQWKVWAVSQKEWSGSFDGLKNQAPLAIGAEVFLEFQESAVVTEMWRGQAIITDRHAGSVVDGLVTYSYDFQGVHALEWPTT